MVPKRQSCVTMEPRPALTAIVLVCCAVAALGWADYSSKPLADLCGNSVTSHVNMPTDFSWVPSLHCCHTGHGSVNADNNTVLTATHSLLVASTGQWLHSILAS